MSEKDRSADARSADLIRELEAVLGRRVNELEIDNARLRRLSRLLTGGVIVALVLSLGSTLFTRAERSRVADEVQAQRFILRDASGNVRAVLGVTPEGGSRFSMQDPTGTDRLRLTLLADGSPGMSLADDEGRSRAVLAFLPDQTANMVFADRTGRTRAVFGLMPDESTTLVFADRRGETRIGLGVDAGGVGGLSVVEQDTNMPALESMASDTTAAAPDDNVPGATANR